MEPTSAAGGARSSAPDIEPPHPAMAHSFRERFLEAVLESATDYAIIAVDVNGLVTAWNEGARRTLGWSEAEMLGRPAEVIFTDEDRANAIPKVEMSRALADGRGMDERWHVRRDTSRFWASGEMMPLRDVDGSHIGFLKILRDRTEQRLEAERQRADAEFMRGVLSSSADCIKVLDLDGHLLSMNEGGQRTMEVSDFNAIRGCRWPDFWQGEGHVQAKAALDAARAGGVGRFQAIADTMAGNPRYWDVQVTAVLGADGQPERLLSISRDVSVAMLAERALRESEEHRRLAVEAAEIGTWAFEVPARTLHWDDRCRTLFGFAPDEAVTVGIYLRGIHPADRDRVIAVTRAALDPTGSGVSQAEYRTVGLADGIERWVAAMGRATFEGGQAVRLVGTVMDVTTRRRAEEQARLLADELQHRVKNMLAMVQAIVRQTLRMALTPAAAGDAIDSRLAAMGRAHEMLTRNGWEGSELRAVVGAALHPHDDGAASRFRIDGPSAWLPAQAAMSLTLLLHELGTNAAKYGALSVATGHVELSWTVEAPAGTAGGRNLHLVWRERGGPPVEVPPTRGFGSKLIERGLASALNGSAVLTFPREGVICRVEGRLAALSSVST